MMNVYINISFMLMGLRPTSGHPPVSRAGVKNEYSQSTITLNFRHRASRIIAQAFH